MGAFGVLASAALLAACAAPPASPLATFVLPAAASGGDLAAGSVSGLVATCVAGEFQPIAGAVIQVAGSDRRAVSGPDGRYAFSGLTPGSFSLRIAAPGYAPATSRVTLDPVNSVPRANVVLARAGYGLTQVASFDANVSGVVTDPRGAALPSATVHLVDNCANGGVGSNAFVTTDANGFYTATIPAVAVSAASPGVVQVSATGLSPGGVRLDNLNFISGFLAGPAIVLSPQLDTFEAPGTPIITGSSFVAPGGLANVTATGLSSRPDEFYVEVTSGGRVYTVLPSAVSTGTVTFQAPFTLPASTFTARLVPFGKPAGASPASPAFASRYLQADFDNDLTYSVGAALRDTSTGGLDLNGLLFVAGDTAEYTITLANANPVISQDVQLEGTVPVGAAIASATAGGNALAAGSLTQPDAGGRFAVSGVTVPAGGSPVPIAIRFVTPASLTAGSAFQVTAPAVRMPSSSFTKTVAPGIPTALTVQGVDTANFTVTKAFLDDGTAGNGTGQVRLVLTATGSGAIGAFKVTDRTLTDRAIGGTDDILASFAGATASQAGGTTWTFGATSSALNGDGSVSVGFTLTPPAAYAAGDGPTTPLTVVYQLVKAGTNLGLGGGDFGAGFGARVTAANLLAPFTDATRDVVIGGAAADPAAIVGL